MRKTSRYRDGLYGKLSRRKKAHRPTNRLMVRDVLLGRTGRRIAALRVRDLSRPIKIDGVGTYDLIKQSTHKRHGTQCGYKVYFRGERVMGMNRNWDPVKTLAQAKKIISNDLKRTIK